MRVGFVSTVTRPTALIVAPIICVTFWWEVLIQKLNKISGVTDKADGRAGWIPAGCSDPLNLQSDTLVAVHHLYYQSLLKGNTMSLIDQIKNNEFVPSDPKPVMSMFLSSADCKKAREAWNAEKLRLLDLFKREALKETGFENHPKADYFFYRAWDAFYPECDFEKVLNELHRLMSNEEQSS